MSKHYRKENNCLNCGSEVNGKFCGQCGQENLELHEPFWHFLSHSIGHYFHFDSKFFNTVKPLITKPGQLTLDYVVGRRTRFLQPVSMYIFVSIVYFLMISIVEHKKEKPEVKDDTKEVNLKAAELNKLRQNNLVVTNNLLDTVSKTISNRQKKDDFRQLGFIEQTFILDSLEKKKDFDKSLLKSFQKIHADREDSTYQSYLKRQSRLPAGERDNAFVRYITKKTFVAGPANGNRENLSVYSEKYKSKVYFIMMPLFAYFLMLNFRKNKKYYIDHLVFTLHIFTAFFLLEIVFVPLEHILGDSVGQFIGLIAFLILLFYIYKALRVFYQRSQWTTIRKMFTLSLMLGLSFTIGEFLVGSFVLLFA